MSTERELAINHSGTQGTLGRVVGRFDTSYFDKRPKPVTMNIQFATHALQTTIATEGTAQQMSVDRLANRVHLPLEGLPRDFIGSISLPMLEHQLDRLHQVVSHPFHLMVQMIEQRLNITLQMSPAPLQSFGLPVHFGSMAINDSCEHGPQQLGQCVTAATGKDRKDRELLSNRSLQSGFLGAFLRRRFIHVQLQLFPKRFMQFVIRLVESCGHVVLHLHGERSAAGHFQKILQEVGRSSFTLAEVAHQQISEGNQARARLTSRDPRGQSRERDFTTAGVLQTFQAMFDHDRTNLRQLSNLMTQGLRITTFKGAP